MKTILNVLSLATATLSTICLFRNVIEPAPMIILTYCLTDIEFNKLTHSFTIHHVTAAVACIFWYVVKDSFLLEEYAMSLIMMEMSTIPLAASLLVPRNTILYCCLRRIFAIMFLTIRPYATYRAARNIVSYPVQCSIVLYIISTVNVYWGVMIVKNIYLQIKYGKFPYFRELLRLANFPVHLSSI